MLGIVSGGSLVVAKSNLILGSGLGKLPLQVGSAPFAKRVNLPPLCVCRPCSPHLWPTAFARGCREDYGEQLDKQILRFPRTLGGGGWGVRMGGGPSRMRVTSGESSAAT